MTDDHIPPPPYAFDALAHYAGQVGLSLREEQVRQFAEYARLLLEWNANVNLTAITDLGGVEVRHFMDSLSVVRAVPLSAAARIVDVGTGAGFPGLPLRIAIPGLRVTLLEATGKKAAFLQHVIGALDLRDVTIVNLRAEEAGQIAAHREAYDVVVARAVARLPALAEYLLPLCRVGGRCIAMKGETATAELKDAEKAIRVLGGRPGLVTRVELPGIGDPHYLVTLEKTAPTPAQFPRKPGTPTKKPL